MVAHWFAGKELAFGAGGSVAHARFLSVRHAYPRAALGMNLALARLGSVLNDYISILFDSEYVYLAYWVGFAVCACLLLRDALCALERLPLLTRVLHQASCPYCVRSGVRCSTSAPKCVA